MASGEASEASLNPYLRPTHFIESQHPEVKAFARQRSGDAASDREKAVRLFYAVRDEIRYDPYAASLDPEVFQASYTLRRGKNFCVPKAILLAAAARTLGIPARLGFADVRNHLATERLLALMGTDVFVFHGYTELHLDGRWVKATPTFNIRLCEKFGVKPLDFDGEHDAIFHPYDRDGKRHMEYLRERGAFADLPLTEMLEALREAYPHFFDAEGRIRRSGDFEAEAAQEGS